MARKFKVKKEKNSSGLLLRYLIIIAMLGLIFFVGGQQVAEHIKRSRMFLVKSIIVDPADEFDPSDLMYLKNKNIFDVDVDFVQSRLGKQYPQIAYLKVIKRFPDTLIVVAKKRNPFAQVQMRSRLVLIDADGVVISDMGQESTAVPLIQGIKSDKRIKVGSPLDAQNLYAAITIMKIFKENSSLASNAIIRVEVENLSRINLYLSNNINIILDRERVKQKFKMLEVVLSQSKIDLSEVKYIDLRFNEPIIGKKKIN